VEPVKEYLTVETKAEDEVGATPFFSSDSGVILIKGGTVVNCEEMSVADVLVDAGKITAVGEDLEIPEGAAVIDATDKYVLPGGIDTNTHLYQGLDKAAPLKDDFESGTRAALAGGTTMVVDLVIPQRGGSLVEAFTEWKEAGEEKSCCDFALTVAVPHVTEEAKEEMEMLAKEHGVNSFKMFMSYKDTMMLDSADMMEALKHVKELGCIAKVHAEDGNIIAENQKRLLAGGVTGPEGHPLSQPEEVEEEAVLRACTLARQANTPLYICNPTSSAAADTIKAMKAEGLVVYGEPSAAALAVDGSHYYNKCWGHAAAFVSSPPLREAGNKEQLVAALMDGGLDIVGSGHCTYDFNTRAQGKEDFTAIPQGVNGIEERMGVVYERGVVEGKMPMTRYVEVTSTAAAKLLNLYPQKGCIAEGSDADIVIWNTGTSNTITQKTHHQAGDFNIFEGLSVSGAAEFVLCGGKVVVAEYQVNTSPGTGQYIQAPSMPQLAYEKIQQLDSKDKPAPVERDHVPVDDVDGTVGANGTKTAFGLTTPRGYCQQEVFNKQLGIYQRPLSAHGVRNQQDSSFSLAGPRKARAGEDMVHSPRRAAVKVNTPPGGHGGAFW
jgi:dihydropyrimidinase